MENPLVSIIVITYNSSKYVLETLESAKAQTYQNIELIISDDGSQDETVNLCKNWLAENKERFIHSQIITVEQNTGIPANCNRGVKASKGEWIKLIAGDDILMPSCIIDNVEYVKIIKSSFIVSDLTYFNSEGVINYTTLYEISKFFSKTYLEQKRHYLKYPLFLNTPSFFYSRALLETVGFFDEQYFYIEDTPLIYRVYENNYKISFLNKKTVLYRKDSGNITTKKSDLNRKLKEDLYLLYKNYRRPRLKNENLCKILTGLDFYFVRKNMTSGILYSFFSKIYSKYKFSI